MFLTKPERANFKAILDFIHNSEDKSWTMTNLVLSTRSNYKNKSQYINHLTLRRLIYILIGSHYLEIKQLGRARIVFVTSKLRNKLKKIYGEVEKDV